MRGLTSLALAILALLASGCVTDPVVTPPPPEAAELSITGGAPLYGGVTIGTSSDLTFSVTNTGALDTVVAPLTSAALNLSGPYALVGGTCQPGMTLHAMGVDSCTITIRFTPVAEAHASVELHLSYNDGLSSTPAVTKLVLDGYGVLDCDNYYQPTLCPVYSPALSISDPVTFDFGNVAIGTSSSHTFTVSNTGRADAVLGDLTGPGLGIVEPFGVVVGGTCQPSGIVTKLGGSCTIVIRFTPTDTVTSANTITVSATATGTGAAPGTFTATRPITGTGVLDCNAYPQPRCPNFAPSLSISDGATYDFGTLDIGSSADHTFTVTNTGETQGFLGTVSTAGLGLAAPFSFVGGTCATGATIAPTVGSCTITVRFTPSAPGGLSSLSIDLKYTDAVNTYDAVRPITGTGVIDCIQFPSTPGCPHATPVYTRHYNLARTGLNDGETLLTPSNVNSTQFGKLFQYSVDGQVYAQPLFVPHLNMPGVGYRNVVFVATEHDSIYALDADSYGTGAPLWQVSFINPGAGITTVPYTDLVCTDIKPEVGITGTPVIDPSTNTLYVAVKTKENGSYFYRLHALDILTGNERGGSPVTISATYSGSGSESFGTGSMSFDPLWQNQRAALTLTNGVVYIAFASHCDNSPFHPWVLGYSASTLAQVFVFNGTPDGADGGIWMDGMGPSVDGAGALYMGIGNGTFDVASGGLDYGESLLKITPGTGFPRATGVASVDYFSPYNSAYLTSHDLDTGSGGMMLVDVPGATSPNLAISGAKNGMLYVLDRNNLGGYDGVSDHVVQELGPFPDQIVSTTATWNGHVYLHADYDVLKDFVFNSSGQLALATSGAYNYVFPGATPTISSNGATNGIVWELDNTKFSTAGAAILHAYDATNVASELYNSSQAAASRDTCGPAIKFTSPTVTNGKVYVGGGSTVTVYGLLGH